MRKKNETDKLPRDSMVIYKGWVKLIKSLPEDQQLEAFYTLFNYAFDHKPIKSKSPFIKLLIETFAPQIDANYSRWENSKKGAEERKNQAKCKKNLQVTEDQNNTTTQNESKTNPNGNQNESKTNPNVYVNANVNENVNVNVNAPKEINKENFEEPVIIENYEQRRNQPNAGNGNQPAINSLPRIKKFSEPWTTEELAAINEAGHQLAINDPFSNH